MVAVADNDSSSSEDDEDESDVEELNIAAEGLKLKTLDFVLT